MRFKPTVRNLTVVGLLLAASTSLVLCSGSFLSTSTMAHCDSATGTTTHAQLMSALQWLTPPNSHLMLLLLLVVLAYQIWAAPQLLSAVSYQRRYGVTERSPGNIRASLYLVALLRSGVIHPKIYQA